ncbi:MAG: hypothetical protein V1716_03525 [Candidatus Uhrbacteria bacterium]
MTSTIPFGTVKLVLETIGRGVFFPVWWYTRGLLDILKFIRGSIKNQYINLGLGVWLANLFVPMYGSTDWASRLISFFIRLFMVVVRGLAMFFWLIIMLLFLVGYLLLLPVSVFGFLFNFVGFFFA